jgi:hypothetical protein
VPAAQGDAGDMIIKSKILFSMAAILVISLTGMSLTSVLTPPSNCGRNSYALTVCQTFALSATLAAQDNNGQFDITNSDKECLRDIARDSWGIGGADLFVKTNFSTDSTTNHDLIIVCTKQFENVPQPTIWNLYHQNPAHAVGYSDGKVGLISPAEFNSLNLNGFVSLSNLITSIQFGVTNQ